MIKKGGRRESSGAFLGCRMPVDPGLVEQGWEWRCNVDGSKLIQVVDLYEELGFEVRLEPVRVDCLSVECKGCQAGLSISKAVFVRPANCQNISSVSIIGKFGE